ncbi:hypothetical protein J4G48_0015115 [Bradyrhizobium barranii subsp. apii]|uniref:hypothetical protein n=1 Tax=Bradyrhizobium barranii TaxID=2992140 RepID=UPI001AA134B3|nr:hypothetical protein [Bradyrhizobium barranii]UPT99294.1 hypothetical protein J4G48_0015115 [Bradyrhizobium barranii subsp. apii]
MDILPRHVRPKRLKTSGKLAYYYDVPSKYRKMDCAVENEPLGTDFAKMLERAKTLNDQFDEWDRARKGLPAAGGKIMPKFGTVDWLFREYKISDAYLRKVAPRSRPDYEWAMDQVCDTLTKKGERTGDQLVKRLSPRTVDKLYGKFLKGTGKKKLEGEERLRTAEKLVGLCRKAWRVVHRYFPAEFDKEVPNPWTGVTMKVRAKAEKSAVTRDEVYTFAWGVIDKYPEIAATAVICFEWLQRPENVVMGHMKWSDYRAPNAPTTIRVVHHKTNKIAPHPLEEKSEEGVVRFYAEAEEVLARLPKLGVQMILRQVGKNSKKEKGKEGIAVPWVYSSINHAVARLRKQVEGVPGHFTLDACRHGGMTELEEAELTDGQGRALSMHSTQRSYEGYAKRTQARMLGATRKRHAHVLAEAVAKSLANEEETNVRNSAPESVRNEKREFPKRA